MNSYHTSFSYLNKNSENDFNLKIAYFDPDNGEMDSSLYQEQIYGETYNGKKRILYGTKYTKSQLIKITLIKEKSQIFSLDEVRSVLKWLTGNPESRWIHFFINDVEKYRLLGTIQDVKTQKIDGRTVGLNVYFESVYPWAFSDRIIINKNITLQDNILEINNDTDDLFGYVIPKVMYTNKSGNTLIIRNKKLDKETRINELKLNETITLSNNMIIQSDSPYKKFGDSFNFVWPKLVPGLNEFEIFGDGFIQFEFCYPIKIGDCAISINDLQ